MKPIAIALLAAVTTHCPAQVCDLLQPQELIATDTLAFGYAGFSTAASGDLAVVGAYGDDRVTIGAGSVAVYRNSNGTWVQEADLLPDPADARRGDWMGYSVATDAQRIVVGVPVGLVDGIKARRAIVYRFDANTGWTVEQTLAAPDGLFNDEFGTSVAIDENVIVVGAPGRDFFNLADNMGGAYVFRYDGSEWAFEDTLFGFSPEEARGGFSVAVDMPFAIIGAPRDASPGLPDTGRAWAFEFSESGWSLPVDLVSAAPESGAWYGHAVAIEGGTAVVGAPFASGPQPSTSGQAGRIDIFGFADASWQFSQACSGPLFQDDQFFGDSLALKQGTLAVGLPGRASRQGAVQIYYADAAGAWSPSADGFIAPAGLPNLSFFGTSVALADNTLLAGADRTDIPATNAGSAWIYTLCDCPADINGDAVANFFDVALFIALYNASDPRADVAEPFGQFNFFDIAAYIALFNAGCP